MGATGSLPPWARKELTKVTIERDQLKARLAEIDKPARPRGRPAIGPTIETRLPPDIGDALRAEAKSESVPVAEMLRRILAERYKETT